MFYIKSIMGEAPVLSSVTQEKPSVWDRITPHQVKHLVAGGVAGAVSRTSVSPFERLKILYQVIYRLVTIICHVVCHMSPYMLCHHYLHVTIYVDVTLYVVSLPVCRISLLVCHTVYCICYVTHLYETHDTQGVTQHTRCILYVTSCVVCSFCVLYKFCLKVFNGHMSSSLS